VESPPEQQARAAASAISANQARTGDRVAGSSSRVAPLLFWCPRPPSAQFRRPKGVEALDESTDPRRPTVALVGPCTESRGGVASTIRSLEHSRLADEFHLIPVSTYRDAGSASKAFEAASGLARLTWLCVCGRVDLVHVHVSAGASLARKSLGIGIARATGVPVVLHVHGGSGFHDGRASSSLLGRLEQRMIRWALESSDAVVALTAGWERSLATRGRLRGLYVIPSAPELAVPVEVTSSGPKRLVLFLGHLYRDKGIYDLLDAFAILRQTRPGLRLVLAGEGPEGHGLRVEASRLGLNAAVELPGWVSPSVKAELLGSAVCLVLPSYHEGLPLVVLEAMVAGVPVVATRVGGVPDIVKDGRDALLVPPHDVDALAAALARVLDDAKLAARLSDAAQRRALAEYTPDALAERVGALYRKVLTKK
jgi:glycosyltransferase involved in cell wall biosynthesis